MPARETTADSPARATTTRTRFTSSTNEEIHMYEPEDFAIENQRAIKAERGCTWLDLARDMDGSDPAFARWMRRQHDVEEVPDVVVVVDPATLTTPEPTAPEPLAPELRDQVREHVREYLDELGIQTPARPLEVAAADDQEVIVQESQEQDRSAAAEARAADSQDTPEGGPEKRKAPPRGRRSTPKGEA